MWFKKKSQISGYNPNTAYDGTDWRTNGSTNTWSVSNTLPSAADANKYFYLPALGYYRSGKLGYIGISGVYWSSSANPWDSGTAYFLYFSSGGVYVNFDYRYTGFRVGGFE